MAAQRDPHTTLGGAAQQILIDFFDDANGMLWHMQLRLARLPDGKWKMSTLGLDVLSRLLPTPLLQSMAVVTSLVNADYGVCFRGGML